MSDKSSIYESAKSLSRNPLGIIALFIVLVYAVASIVIGFARAEFYQNPSHPAVLFLAIFPILVLCAFTFLVTRYHRNLYAPEDYKDQSHFFFGLNVPSALPLSTNGVATSDPEEKPTDEITANAIENSYSKLLSFGFVLLHQAEVIRPRTSPKSGRYRVRMWIEPIDNQHSLTDISSVAYHVWSDFKRPVRSSADFRSSFDLWLSIYGEFPALALVTTKNGNTFELQRFVDLPGRPPD